MPKAIALRSFLLKQVDGENGKKKDVIVQKGQAYDVDQADLKKFPNDFKSLDAKKK